VYSLLVDPDKIPLSLGESKDSRAFEKLVLWVSALSIAAMAGFLASLKQVNPAIVLRFSAMSLVAFVAGGVLTALFLRAVLRANKRRRVLLVLAAAVASVLGYFLFAIKNTSRENRSDVTIGTLIALVVLSFVGLVLWRVVRFFESDQAPDRDEAG
jgi:Na+/proline symporter